jgi:NAD(P)-dependent dehydrogenase (short-subunit alcohol dehydrogenase family)
MRPGETRVHELTSEVWDATFRVNLRGLWLSCKTCKKKYLARIPLGRFGKGEDIAGLAVFLASDDSSYCTGAIYVADGGLTLV